MTQQWYTKGTQVTSRLVAILKDNADELGLENVYWGLEMLVPTYPVALVISDPKDRDIQRGSTHMFAMALRASIIIVHQDIQSATLTREETERQAETVEDFLMKDLYLTDVDGTKRVIFGIVTRVEPGVLRLGSVMTQATRLRWEAMSRQEF